VLYQIGIVVEALGQTVRVEFIRSGSCGGCAGDQGCGLGPILAMFRRPRPHSLEFDTGDGGLELKVGDTVRIAMAGHQLLKIVGLAYLLPLLGMFSGAWLAAAAIPGSPDISAVVGALSGLFCVSALLARTGVVEAGSYLQNAQLQSLTPVQTSGD
jgi:positive regulator of sigma E activity